MTTDQGPFTPGWVPSPPDYRDYTLRSRLPAVLFKAAPPSVPSLTKATPILDQGNLGSCTAFASGSCFFFIDGGDKVNFDVSELAQYYNARVESGLPVNQDTGAFNRAAASALAKYGMAPEADWHYDISRFAQKPPDIAYQHAAGHKAIEYVSVPNDVETMKQVLAAGFPIVIGFTVYQNYNQGLSTGDWPMPGGAAIGGHAVCVDGYEPGWWLFRNSWGPSVGRQGWFRMPWQYLLSSGDDFWVYKKVTADVIEPGPEPTPTPTDWTDEQVEAEFVRRFGNVAAVDIGFQLKGYRWPLAIQPPTGGLDGG